VLALPNLYGAFNTSIVGVSWVITSYNLVVAVAAALIALIAKRLDVRLWSRIGLTLFTLASIGCAASQDLPMLIAFRCVQGLGAACLLTTSIALLGGLLGSRERGISVWTNVAVLGAALGPVLGGVLTQLFDWRAIFVVQAPLAGVALLATGGAVVAETTERRRRGALAADLAVGFVFAALVGALFLAVLLVITVWGLSPIKGALVVSALPLGTLAARSIGRGLRVVEAVGGGVLLLAAGLVALALLPRVSNLLVGIALAFCGIGIGLAVPVLTRAALHQDSGLLRSGAITVSARHAGLVLALALVAPLLTSALNTAGQNAMLGGTKAILDANIPLTKKVPIALGMRNEFQSAQKGEIPNLGKPFDDAGAKTNAHVRQARDSLVTTLEGALARGFRSSFLLSALFALLALIPALRLRRAT
jgi:predicted MFS family arabinose efflux permease